MNTLYGEWTRCEDCICFDDCDTKENRDGCYFGNNGKEERMDTPETINVEKYIEALNNLLGADNAYYAGDPDVDTIVELIKIAKKLEDRVKELTEENERLREDISVQYKIIDERSSEIMGYNKCIRTLHNDITMLEDENKSLRKNAIKIDRIVKEMLEEQS